MDSLIGITGKDFILLATDAMCGRSIIVFKQDEDKQLQLNQNVVMAMSGSSGDRDAFGNLIKRNISLKELRDQRQLDTAEVANFTRSELHDALRSGPFQVNLLIAGVDKDVEQNAVPQLFYMDHLASMVQVPYGVHGHSSNFLLSLLDAEWKKDLDQAQAIELFKRCKGELSTRFLINFSAWTIRILTKDGVQDVTV